MEAGGKQSKWFSKLFSVADNSFHQCKLNWDYQNNNPVEDT